jgi:hypothetical protein
LSCPGWMQRPQDLFKLLRPRALAFLVVWCCWDGLIFLVRRLQRSHVGVFERRVLRVLRLRETVAAYLAGEGLDAILEARAGGLVAVPDASQHDGHLDCGQSAGCARAVGPGEQLVCGVHCSCKRHVGIPTCRLESQRARAQQWQASDTPASSHLVAGIYGLLRPDKQFAAVKGDLCQSQPCFFNHAFGSASQQFCPASTLAAQVLLCSMCWWYLL